MGFLIGDCFSRSFFCDLLNNSCRFGCRVLYCLIFFVVSWWRFLLNWVCKVLDLIFLRKFNWIMLLEFIFLFFLCVCVFVCCGGCFVLFVGFICFDYSCGLEKLFFYLCSSFLIFCLDEVVIVLNLIYLLLLIVVLIICGYGLIVVRFL